MHSRRIRTTILATALAAVGVLAYAALCLGRAPATVIAVELDGVPAQDFVEVPRLQRAIETAHARTAVLVPVEPAVAASRSVTKIPSAATRNTSRESARESAGRLRIRAIDADTGAPLVQVRVRALSGDRIADRDSGVGRGDLELTLTPGSYAYLVLSAGYEPAESAMGLARGESLETTIALRGGRARIDGRVRGDLPPDDSLRIELIGHGRRPCPRCRETEKPRVGPPDSERTAWMRGDPCPSCGYSSSASYAPVGADGRFSFERLASGDYAVRLVDPDGRTVGEPRPVALRDSESARVELRAVVPRFVEVEFVDTDGSTLAGEWSRRTLARAEETTDLESIEMESVPACIWSCSLRDGARVVAQGAFHTPTLPGHAVVWGVGSRCCGVGRRRSSIDDSARDGTELLRPVAPEPAFRPSEITCELDAEGRVRFGPLPPWALTLEAQCATYSVSVAVPAATADMRFRARLSALAEGGDLQDGEARTSRPGAATFREFEAARYR